MSNISTSAHFYDGKLETSIASIKDRLDEVQMITPTEKSRVFSELATIIESPLARKSLRVIISDFQRYAQTTHPANQNYDSKNRLFACDLLYLVYHKIQSIADKKERSVFTLLVVEQLQDMLTGICAQGRTTRLLQLLL